jgi:hypothetical protein
MQLHVRVAVGPPGTERTLVVDGCEAGATTVGEVKKKVSEREGGGGNRERRRKHAAPARSHRTLP